MSTDLKHRDLPAPERLAAINAMIAGHPALAAQGYLFKHIGDRSKREPELLELTRIVDDVEADPFHLYLHLRVLLPDGKEAPRPIRVNRNGGGACMLVVVNSKIAVVKQCRIPLGLRWTYEFPRGYAEIGDQHKIEGHLANLRLGDLKLGVVERELGEEIAKAARIRALAHLSNIALNTGPDATVTPIYVVTVSVPDALFRERCYADDAEGIEVVFWDIERMRSEIGLKINDAITLAMWQLYERWRADLP